MGSSLSFSPARRVVVPRIEAEVPRKREALFPVAEGRRWLNAVQPDLGGSPRELLARGEGERVLRILTCLEQGIPT